MVHHVCRSDLSIPDTRETGTNRGDRSGKDNEEAGMDGKLYIVLENEPQSVHVFVTSGIKELQRQAAAPPDQVRLLEEETLVTDSHIHWIGVS
jgi:hypothetical protein